MSKKFLVPIHLASLANDPSVAAPGVIYFNTSLNKVRYFDGTEWSSLEKESSYSYNITDNDLNIVDQWDASTYTTVEYTLQIKQNNKIRSSKILAVTNENLFYYTEYSIIEIGGEISGLSIDVEGSNSNGQLMIQISDAATNNAQVKFLKSIVA